MKKRISVHRVSRSFGGDLAIVLFLALLSVLMMLPLVYTVLQSLKPMEELFIFPPRFTVRHWGISAICFC